MWAMLLVESLAILVLIVAAAEYRMKWLENAAAAEEWRNRNRRLRSDLLSARYELDEAKREAAEQWHRAESYSPAELETDA